MRIENPSRLRRTRLVVSAAVEVDDDLALAVQELRGKPSEDRRDVPPDEPAQDTLRDLCRLAIAAMVAKLRADGKRIRLEAAEATAAELRTQLGLAPSRETPGKPEG